MSAASQFFGGGGGGGSQVVEVFAVGGGGPGGGAPNAPGAPGSYVTFGGGGGGGQVTYTRTLVTPGKTYDITIGSAGSPTIFGDIVSYGGAAGGTPSLLGSSGGGSSFYGPWPAGPGFMYGAANTTYPTPVIDTNNVRFSAPGSGTSGGGGFTGVVIGVPGTFGGGGGPGVRPSVPAPTPSGTGQGGQGARRGGPGAPLPGYYPEGAGGSGTIIIRFPTAFDAATVTGDTPVTPQPGYYVYQWNSGPGTIVFN